MMHTYRTHTCNELRSENAGSRIKLSGWINRKRDHSNLIFIDEQSVKLPINYLNKLTIKTIFGHENDN